MRSSNPALASAFSTKTPDRSLSELLGPPPEARPSAVDTEVRTDRMTIEGVIHRTLFLLGLLIAGGIFGYQSVTVTDESTVNIPGWVMGAMLVGIGLVFLNLFRPQYAKFVSPAYAVVMGTVVGAISKVYEIRFDGIVLQAAGLTVSVFLLMLALYASRTIRATPRLISGIVAATGAVFVMYLVTFVLGLFGVDLPFIHDSGPIGILFSLGLVWPGRLQLHPRLLRDRERRGGGRPGGPQLAGCLRHRPDAGVAVPRDAPPAVEAPVLSAVPAGRRSQPGAGSAGPAGLSLAGISTILVGVIRPEPSWRTGRWPPRSTTCLQLSWTWVGTSSAGATSRTTSSSPRRASTTTSSTRCRG